VLAVHDAIITTKQDGWLNNSIKTRMVRFAIRDVLKDEQKTDHILDIAKNQEEYI